MSWVAIGLQPLSESLPAYDVVHMLNRFFNRAGLAVEANVGRVDNYMGDGLLALFGIENHDFKLRIWISLGEVIFGLMGGEPSARETVIGDAVNTASRLESANKAAGIRMLVTEEVHEETAGRVEFGPRLELELQGKDAHVVAYSVVGLSEPDPH